MEIPKLTRKNNNKQPKDLPSGILNLNDIKNLKEKIETINDHSKIHKNKKGKPRLKLLHSKLKFISLSKRRKRKNVLADSKKIIKTNLRPRVGQDRVKKDSVILLSSSDDEAKEASQSLVCSSETYVSSQSSVASNITRNVAAPVTMRAKSMKYSSLCVTDVSGVDTNVKSIRKKDILNDFITGDARSNAGEKSARVIVPSTVGFCTSDEQTNTDIISKMAKRDSSKKVHQNSFNVEDINGDASNRSFNMQDVRTNIHRNDSDVNESSNVLITNFQNSNSKDVSYSKCLDVSDDDATLQTSVVSNGIADVPEDSACWKRPQFYTFKNKVIVILYPKRKFYFCGKLRVKVLYGCVEIYGSILSSLETIVPAEVYSPRGYSLVSIEAVGSSSVNNLDDALHMLRAEGVHHATPNTLQVDIKKKCRNGQAIVMLENLENNLTKFLSTYCPFKLFPKVEDSDGYPEDYPKNAGMVLQSNFCFDDKSRQLKLNFLWKTKLGQVLDRCSSESRSCVLIAGGKGVGKSTTARYLVNGMLSKTKTKMVVLMDLDLGQTECTPSGCISLNVIKQPLMGPNFTHLKTPFYQLHIGDVNVVNCILNYVNGVKKLVDYLANCQELAGLPIVVNTMGFCKGMGWDIVVYIIKLILPTDVVQITSRRLKNNFDESLTSEVIQRQNSKWISWGKDTFDRDSMSLRYDLHIVHSQAEEKNQLCDSWEMEPYQQRDLVMLAYLSQIIQNTENFKLRNYLSSPSINDILPYMVPLPTLSVSLTRSGVPASHILSAMNGNIVALCGVDLENECLESNNELNSSYPRALIRTPLCTCYGFGIVRGIDIEKGQAFVNTPLSAYMMRFVNCFVGSVPVPLNMLRLHHGVPYTGGQDNLPMSRESRRGYFRMKQQNKS